MTTGSGMLTVLLLGCLVQSSTSADSLIPGISSVFGDSLGPSGTNQYAPYPNQYQPQPHPNRPFPTQPYFLTPYPKQVSSGQSVPGPYQSRPNQLPGVYQGVNGYSGSGQRYTPEQILAFMYQINRPKAGPSPTQYYKHVGPNSYVSGSPKSHSNSKKTYCHAGQLVCKACLPHKPCFYYCC